MSEVDRQWTFQDEFLGLLKRETSKKDEKQRRGKKLELCSTAVKPGLRKSKNGTPQGGSWGGGIKHRAMAKRTTGRGPDPRWGEARPKSRRGAITHRQ